MQKIIRLRHRIRSSKSTLIEIIVTTAKTRSQYRIYERLGFIHKHDYDIKFRLNTQRLGYWLNKGATLKKSVKRYIAIFAQTKEGNVKD